ncbi:hypothetical protein PGT21_035065 [Puccinia graminis f. sp. tritici]|uniref:Uncharacterized protein n=1 Tax=Puccinia graminis f. sp. tritici TaxID=56615 RepID=A0A5B0QCM0_PUCGR|nr:hypothetical protein PGT21_035065 [Puccinia graminis f. sp. tritici]
MQPAASVSNPAPQIIEAGELRAPPTAAEPRAKRPRRPATQGVVRTPRVIPAAHDHNSRPATITPSRIISDSDQGTSSPTAESAQPGIVVARQRIPPLGSAPTITPTRILHHSGSRVLTAPSRPPSITPSRIIADSPLPPIVPIDPIFNNDDEEPQLQDSEDEDSTSGDLDGFIRPPPPVAVHQPTEMSNVSPPPPASAVGQLAPHTSATTAPPPPRQISPADPLVEALLASSQLSHADLQLARQLFNPMVPVSCHVDEDTSSHSPQPNRSSSQWTSTACVRNRSQAGPNRSMGTFLSILLSH